MRAHGARYRSKLHGLLAAGTKLQSPAAEHLTKIHTALERRPLRTRYYSASRHREHAPREQSTRDKFVVAGRSAWL